MTPDTQISDEMVDIAARAVYAVSVQAVEPALGIPMCKFEELPERDLNLHRDYARAALQAALSGHVVVPREPTEAMSLAGANTLPDYEPSCDDARNCYRAMIQAAPPVQEMEG